MTASGKRVVLIDLPTVLIVVALVALFAPTPDVAAAFGRGLIYWSCLAAATLLAFYRAVTTRSIRNWVEVLVCVGVAVGLYFLVG